MRLRNASRITVAAVLVLGAVTVGSPPPLFVSSDGGDFESIQDAIDTAVPDGIVVIGRGTYRENLFIDCPITLIGEDGAAVEPVDPLQAVIAVKDAQSVSIQGLTIRAEELGIDLLDSSCAITDCSVSTSGTAIHSIAFGDTTVRIQNVEFRGVGGGIGLALLGTATTLLSRCSFHRLTTGALIGGVGVTIVHGCTFEQCFDGIVTLNTVPAMLIENTIRGNYGSGISLSQHPANLPDETLVLLGNVIEENGYWGMSLCGFDAIEPDIQFGQIEGRDNAFRDNRRGRTCPEDLALPAGFFLEE